MATLAVSGGATLFAEGLARRIKLWDPHASASFLHQEEGSSLWPYALAQEPVLEETVYAAGEVLAGPSPLATLILALERISDLEAHHSFFISSRLDPQLASSFAVTLVMTEACPFTWVCPLSEAPVKAGSLELRLS